jgi:hypothetical protein
MPEDFDEMEKENEKDRPDVRLALVWWVSLRWLLLPLLEVATQAVAPSTRGCYAGCCSLYSRLLRRWRVPTDTPTTKFSCCFSFMVIGVVL